MIKADALASAFLLVWGFVQGVRGFAQEEGLGFAKGEGLAFGQGGEDGRRA